jgi:hypothetical protein
MKKAAKRSEKERETREVIRSSAYCSFMPGVVRNLNPSLASSLKSKLSRETSGNTHYVDAVSTMQSNTQTTPDGAGSDGSSYYGSVKG